MLQECIEIGLGKGGNGEEGYNINKTIINH